MSTDEHERDSAMDERLSRAGLRWRAANEAPARPGFDEVYLIPITSSGESAGAPAHARRWIIAAAGIAAAVAAAIVGIAVGTSPDRPAPQPASGSADLLGTAWQLSVIQPAGAAPQLARQAAQLSITSAGVLAASDQCNELGGQVSVGPGTLSIGPVSSTAMGCLDPGSTPSVPAQIRLIDAVLTGRVTWAIADGQLTITKAGVGSLTYRGAAAAPTPGTDPSLLAAGNLWRLDTIIQGGASSSVDLAAGQQAATLRFGPAGTFTGSDGCNSFSATASITAGRMDITMGISTMMACRVGADIEGRVRTVLQGEVVWSISNDQLTISKGPTTLVYGALGTGQPVGISSSTAAHASGSPAR